MHVPSVLESDRLHNRIVKGLIGSELFEHWRKRIPLHFRQDARTKYGYAPRSPGYKAYKSRRFKSRRDLVKTGATERLMKSQHPRITVGGSAIGGKGNGVNGRMWMNFGWDALVATHMRAKFKHIRNAKQRAATIAAIKVKSGANLAQMRKEIQAFTDQEREEIARSIQQGYVERVNNDTTPRQRRVVN